MPCQPPPEMQAHTHAGAHQHVQARTHTEAHTAAPHLEAVVGHRDGQQRGSGRNEQDAHVGQGHEVQGLAQQSKMCTRKVQCEG